MSVKIKSITFHNNGFTCFEKTGRFQGDNQIMVYFRRKDYAEVVKSLSLEAFGDGKISSVCFQEKEMEQVDDLSIQINDNDSFTSLLHSLKGAEVVVTIGSGLDDKKVKGMLIGCEDFNKDSGKSGTFVNLFVGGSTVESFDLLNLKNLHICDETLQKDIQHALDLYIAQKNKDLFKLTVFTKGKEYEVNVGYSITCPRWTTSYRLYTNEETPKTAVLKAYAILENTQEEDWSNVDVTLITGVPSSSIVSSDQIDVNSGSILVNVKKDGSSWKVKVNGHDLVETLKKKIAKASHYKDESISLIYSGKPLEDGRTVGDYNIRYGSVVKVVIRDRHTKTVESSGRNFRLSHTSTQSKYSIPGVSVKRNQSAFLQILEKAVPVQWVTLYNSALRKGNPLCSIIFENTTGLTLLEGDMIIKRGQTQKTLGECMLEQMWPKDQSLYSFAVEMGIEVTVSDNFSKLDVHRIEIEQGVWKMWRYVKVRTMYNLWNKTERKFGKMFIDHYFKDGWKLVDSAEPLDITDKTYRFETSLNAKEKKTFNVRELSTDVQTIYLSSVSSELIDKWAELGILDEKVVGELRKILEYRTEIASLQKAVYRTDENMRESNKVQDRARSNIKVLEDPKMKAKYVAILAKEDDKISKYEQTRKEIMAKKQMMMLQRDQHMKSISFKKLIKERVLN